MTRCAIIGKLERSRVGSKSLNLCDELCFYFIEELEDVIVARCDRDRACCCCSTSKLKIYDIICAI